MKTKNNKKISDYYVDIISIYCTLDSNYSWIVICNAIHQSKLSLIIQGFVSMDYKEILSLQEGYAKI